MLYQSELKSEKGDRFRPRAYAAGFGAAAIFAFVLGAAKSWGIPIARRAEQVYSDSHVYRPNDNHTIIESIFLIGRLAEW